ncbi:MAG: FUN14 domain-containing protein [Candidatus Tectimicrobiota bacterium]
MATDWFSTISPHWQAALIGAASGFVTGLILRRAVKSLVVLVGVALAIYLIIASTTDWLEGVEVAATGRHAFAYAKAHRGDVVAAVRRFAKTQLAGSAGFAVGLLGGIALTSRRRPRPAPPTNS